MRVGMTTNVEYSSGIPFFHSNFGITRGGRTTRTTHWLRDIAKSVAGPRMGRKIRADIHHGFDPLRTSTATVLARVKPVRRPKYVRYAAAERTHRSPHIGLRPERLRSNAARSSPSRMAVTVRVDGAGRLRTAATAARATSGSG